MSRASDYLRHALDACERIDEYTRNQTLAGFLGSRILQDAVLRNFEVLGEAIVQLRDDDPLLLGRFPQVAWKETIAFRNRLIHGYANVDFAVVWQTIQADLPRLRAQLQEIAAQV
jgi:uncharacterized protein with HEPN domain